MLALLAALLLSPSAQEPSGTLIVLNKSDDTASLIDPASGETRALVPTGPEPHEAAVSADGSLAIVTNYGGRTLTLIDLAAGEPAGEIELGTFEGPHGIAAIPGSSRLLVTAERQKTLLEVDLAEAKIVRTFDTDQEVSHMVAVSPDGRHAFTSNLGSGSVSAIDLESGELRGIVETGTQCEGLAITPDGKAVWASNRSDDTLSVIDAETLEVEATLATASFPIRVAITPDGKRALVSCAGADEVQVFDVAGKKRVGRVAMAFEPVEGSEKHLFGAEFAERATPIGILIAPGGRTAYVANANSNLVAVVDIAGAKVEGTIATGREPDGLGWAP